MTFSPQINSFWLFGNGIYDRVDGGDIFSKKNFGLRRLRFHATSHLKIEAKLFFLVNAKVTI